MDLSISPCNPSMFTQVHDCYFSGVNLLCYVLSSVISVDAFGINSILSDINVAIPTSSWLLFFVCLCISFYINFSL